MNRSREPEREHGRWSSHRKREVVLHVLRGEDREDRRLLAVEFAECGAIISEFPLG